MAKFLPFVVEKSTPLHVFQTLVTRSKGLNDLLVASILHLVVDKGITKVRKTASELPEMDLDKLYEALINAYPKYRISNEYYSKMHLLSDHVHLWYPDEISKELSEYSTSDTMNFLLVMVMLNKLEDYTSLHLGKIYTAKATRIENSIKELELFSSDGEEYFFNSLDDVKAYIWCHALIAPRKKEVLAVRAVYNPSTSNTKRKRKKRKPKSSAKYGESPEPRFDQEYDPRSKPIPDYPREAYEEAKWQETKAKHNAEYEKATSEKAMPWEDDKIPPESPRFSRDKP